MDRKPLDAIAISTMVLLTFVWGFTHVAAKLAAHDVSFVMQGGLRSVISTVLLFVWARYRGTPLFQRDGTLGPGLLAGVLVLAEPLRAPFVIAVALVGAGIYLVNRAPR